MDFTEIKKTNPPNFDPVVILIYKRLRGKQPPDIKYLMDELLNYLIDEKEDNLKE